MSPSPLINMVINWARFLAFSTLTGTRFVTNPKYLLVEMQLEIGRHRQSTARSIQLNNSKALSYDYPLLQKG
jgi:hypothetical protein